MSESELLQILARGEDSHHQFTPKSPAKSPRK